MDRVEPPNRIEDTAQNENPPITREFANALGRGLRQLLEEPIKQSEKDFYMLATSPNLDQKNSGSITTMHESLDRFKGIIDKFMHSKEVKILPSPGGPYFWFSEEREQETKPIESEITIDKNSSPELIVLRKAMQDIFRNAISPFSGFSELVQDRSEIAKDPSSWLRAGSTNLSAKLLLNLLDPILNAESQIKITTDAQGKTTIEGISPFKFPSIPKLDDDEDPFDDEATSHT